MPQGGISTAPKGAGLARHFGRDRSRKYDDCYAMRTLQLAGRRTV